MRREMLARSCRWRKSCGDGAGVCFLAPASPTQREVVSVASELSTVGRLFLPRFLDDVHMVEDLISPCHLRF